jgi:hypothetical protein
MSWDVAAAAAASPSSADDVDEDEENITGFLPNGFFGFFDALFSS